MLTVVATLAGLASICVVVRDVVHELFHPSGTGTLSRRTRRAVWGAFRRLADGRPGRLAMAGPTMLVAVIMVWTALLAFGWALVYLPHLPERFRFASPLTPAAEGGFDTALYVSLVTLSTLGFGDVTPTHPLLRVAATVEGFLGFALLTAGITWVLSIKPVLAARRALAVTIRGLVDAERSTGALLHQLDADDAGPQYLSLAVQVARVRSDLLQSPETYYFHPDSEDSSLAAMLPYLHARVRAAASVGGGASRFHAATLESGLDHLGRVLAQQFLEMEGAPTEEVFVAYARDHLRAQSGRPG